MAKKSKGFAVVDFGSEEEGQGGSRRVRIKPVGDYPAKITGVKKGESPDKGSARLEVTFQITAGKNEGKEITEDYYFSPKSLFRLRNLLEALGMKVPKSRLKIPFAKMKGKEVGITIADDKPYEGKIKSRVTDTMDVEDVEAPADEVSDDDEDEDVDEDEESEEEDDDDEDEEDEDDEEEADDDELEEMDLDDEL